MTLRSAHSRSQVAVLMLLRGLALGRRPWRRGQVASLLQGITGERLLNTRGSEQQQCWRGACGHHPAYRSFWCKKSDTLTLKCLKTTTISSWFLLVQNLQMSCLDASNSTAWMRSRLTLVTCVTTIRKTLRIVAKGDNNCCTSRKSAGSILNIEKTKLPPQRE